MEVLLGTPPDIERWMGLVRRLRWNFPGLETEAGMEEHCRTVLKFMYKRQALCVKREDEIAGVLLFSRSKNRICFLAAAPEYRRQGIASALLEKALIELDRGKDISVSTFCESDGKGIAPRALYKKFGFQEGEITEVFGYPNQVFLLPLSPQS